MQRYSDHCAGSFIEEKETSLAWHYRNVDAEQAALRKGQLREDIRCIIANDTRLCLVEGHKVVEIRRAGYDKGYTALKLLKDGAYDFILAIGDDKTDEDLFKILPPDAITVKVGMVASFAKYNIRSQSDVSRFINALPAGAST